MYILLYSERGVKSSLSKVSEVSSTKLKVITLEGGSSYITSRFLGRIKA